MPEWLNGPVNEVLKVTGSHLPAVGGALVVLIVGWIIALAARRATFSLLCKTDWDDKLAEFVGFDTGGDKGNRVERMIARVVYYLFMLAMLVVLFSVLQLDAITKPLLEVLEGFASAVPNIAKAGLFAAGGYVVALVVRAVLQRGLDMVDFDDRIATIEEEDRGEDDDEDEEDDDRPEPSEVIANIAYWFVLVVTAIPVLHALNADLLAKPLSEALTKITRYLPQVAGASVILVIGYLASRIVRSLVTSLLKTVGLDRVLKRLGLAKALRGHRLSRIIGTIAMAFVLLHAAISAVDQLAIEAISSPARAVLQQIYAYVPKLFVGGVLMAIGVALARVVGNITGRLVAAIGFNTLMQHIGIVTSVSTEAKEQEEQARKAVEALEGGAKKDDELDKLLETRKGVHTPADVVGVAVTAVIVLLFARQVLSTIGLEGLATMFDRFIGYLPQVLIAALVLGAGMWAARWAERRVDELTAKSKDRITKALGMVARVSIIAVSAMIALQQLGVGQRIITVAFGLILGAVCLAAALAFGLGGREVAAKILTEEYERRKSSG
jgi:hypothetical protein